MKQKIKKVLMMSCLLVSGVIFAQVKMVNGTVSDSDGVPLPGASIVSIETNEGATTDFDGNFSISVQEGATIEFSFIGYEKQQVVVGESSTINVTLVQGNALSEVVVTSFGIKREEKTLAYSTQTVGSEELTQARDINVANSLNGRAAGVEIRKSSSGAGGSTRIVLRGNKSLSGNSQPLIVIDGVPMVNNVGGQPGMWGGIDEGDGLSQVNPDDVESITILKGANASILYGSQGANGVVVITTKSGEAGDTKVTFNSGITSESVINLPELQYNYGRVGEASESWSPSPNANSANGKFVDDFFQTGVNYVNSVSVSGGNDTTTAYFSYYNTTSSGILDNFGYKKNNLSFKQSTKFLNDKMTLSSNIILTDEQTDNRGPSGYYLNPIVGLYTFPRNESWSSIKTYQTLNPTTNVMDQNWLGINNHFQSNPYWVMNNQPKEDKIKRAIGSLNLKYEINEKLSFQARASYDFSNKSYEQRHAAGSNATNTGTNGRWDYKKFNDELFYSDAILSFNDNYGDFSLTAIAGASLQKTTFGSGVQVSSGNDGLLFYANEFNFQNLPTNTQVQSTLASRVDKQAMFGNVVIGYKDALFLDFSGRNDYASTLAGTGNESYFYPSVGASLVLSQMMELPSQISFLKLRASSASVGNEVPYNSISPTNTINASGGVERNTQTPFSTLKPEMIETFEIGVDLRLFNNKLGLDVAYYDIKSTDQFLSLAAPSGSGYTSYFVNAGKIVNNGIEVTITNSIIDNANFKWNSILNITQNTNEIVEIHPDISALNTGASEGFQSQMRKGGSVGDFYTFMHKRDAQGRIEMAAGVPLRGAERVLAGNAEPDVSLGWSNNVNIGESLSVGFIINAKFGGEVFSQTESMLDGNGVSLRSGQARDAGFVAVNGVEGGVAVSQADPKTWYQAIGDRNGTGEDYVYDRTNIRLSQMSIAYKLNPIKLGLPVDNATISVIGNNLFYSAVAPFDPELAMSTNRNAQGLDNFNLPSTRTIGMNLRLTF
jgi:TonB-linked SusC/RagA family outer membrane protein